MKNVLNFPDHARIREEAGFWLIRLDSGSMSEEEVRAFRSWLEISEEHRKVVTELAGLWDDMDIMSELSGLFPLSQSTQAKPRTLARFSTPAVISLCAAAAIVAAVGLAFLHKHGLVPQQDAGAAEETVYQTSVGELKEITLPDGSSVKLNTDTLVSVDFSTDRRDLLLLRGEAEFNVAHDRSRPFIVHAGDGVVRAVGTAFSVRLKGADVEVTVTQGRVEIASGAAKDIPSDTADRKSDTHLATLDAGQTAEYGEHRIHSIKSIAPDVISRRLSWQNGTLVFKGETLEQVVREISRYTNKRIVISDPAIRNLRIGGYFKTGEVDTLLAVLKNNFSIRADRVGDDLIYLTENKPVHADAR